MHVISYHACHIICKPGEIRRLAIFTKTPHKNITIYTKSYDNDVMNNDKIHL